MTPTVLIVGGAGYIGSHTCHAFAEAGFLPVTVDNLSLGHRHFVQWGPLIEADICNASAIVEVIRTYNPIGVVHFAAYAYVGESMIEPAKYYENNVVGTMTLLDAMRQTDLHVIVFSSSCAVYGAPHVDRISEQVVPTPINPYGTSKLVCEMILNDYVKAYGLRRISLRYFNASGADPKAGIGEDRRFETRLIPRAMLFLLGRIGDFQVFGNDFATPDGTAIRDYIHVRDLSRAHVLALRHLLDGHEGGTFNLGSGQGYSVNEVLQAISNKAGRSFASVGGSRRSGDPPSLIADASLAQRTLGFRPEHSDIKTIIADAWSWHTSGRTRHNRRLASAPSGFQ
jgi:UDP-arabinose 4-epimerase